MMCTSCTCHKDYKSNMQCRSSGVTNHQTLLGEYNICCYKIKNISGLTSDTSHDKRYKCIGKLYICMGPDAYWIKLYI